MKISKCAISILIIFSIGAGFIVRYSYNDLIPAEFKGPSAEQIERQQEIKLQSEERMARYPAYRARI